MYKFSCLLLLISFQIHSQIKVEYDYIIGNNESTTINKCYLYADGLNSKFVSRRVIDGILDCSYTHTNPEILEFMNAKFKKSAGDSIGQLVVKRNNSDSLYCRYYNTDQKYIKTLEFVKPNFSILDEFKIIFKYKCQKALVTLNERDFEVWFTTEIPISSGPWKLSGLLGLILSAKTLDSFHNFQITSLIKHLPFENVFFDFPYSKIVSKKMYVEQYLSDTENSFKYKKSQRHDSNSKLKIDVLDLPITFFK